MTHLFKTAAAAFTLTLAGAASAQSIHPVLGLGLTFGGETLARISFDDETSQKIRAGGLAHLYAGVRADIAPGLALRATLGYHEDSANASNLRVTFARVPLELVGQYQLADRVWIGLGLRKSYAVKYWARGTATAGTVRDATFTSDPGLIVEAEYRITDLVALSLRGVSEQYQFENGTNLRASHVGFYATLTF